MDDVSLFIFFYGEFHLTMFIYQFSMKYFRIGGKITFRFFFLGWNILIAIDLFILHLRDLKLLINSYKRVRSDP